MLATLTIPACLKAASTIWSSPANDPVWDAAALAPAADLPTFKAIIGFFVTVLFFGPHIPFFKSILGFGWPHVSNVIIMIAAAVTLSVLVMLMVRRMIHPVLQKISTADDYISVVVTILPLITGFMSYANLGFIKETNLALHIMSFQLVLLWFPFGKLMHLFLVFPSRFQVGATFGRRGVKA